MAFDDLRSFLQALDEQGQLLKIEEEVNAEPDLAAAANATGRIGDGAPALWFDNIRGFTDARVVMNTIGSWQNHAISMGLPANTPVKKQIDEFIRRWDKFPIAPERRANPAWAQNTVDGEDINLFDILPLFRLNDGDGGFYLDKACVVSRDPLDPDSTMGMLIDAAHADTVHSFIREGTRKGTLLLDGREQSWPSAVGPTIFVDIDPASPLCREEIFGPVLVVTRFKTEEEALTLANDSEYGLGAAVWTRDLSRAHRMSRRLKAGSVFVNNYNDGDMTVPFGGYKQSGNGRDKSLHALEKFTELKTIWIALEPQS